MNSYEMLQVQRLQVLIPNAQQSGTASVEICHTGGAGKATGAQSTNVGMGAIYACKTWGPSCATQIPAGRQKSYPASNSGSLGQATPQQGH